MNPEKKDHRLQKHHIEGSCDTENWSNGWWKFKLY